MDTHEDVSLKDDAKLGSERSFGFVFTGFFAIVAAYALWKGRDIAWLWLGAALLFAAAAVFFPRVLRPLNFVWFKFGLLLHHIVSPVVLGLMFFTVFLPIGLLMRAFGKRPLSLRCQKDKASYGVERTPPGPKSGSFNHQF